MLMGGEPGAAWKPGEQGESKLAFIGRILPRDMLMQGLAQCVASANDATSRWPDLAGS